MVRICWSSGIVLICIDLSTIVLKSKYSEEQLTLRELTWCIPWALGYLVFYRDLEHLDKYLEYQKYLDHLEPSTYTRDTCSTWLTGTPGIFWTLGYLAYQRYPEHLDTPGMTGRPGALGYLVYQGYLKRLHVNYSKDTQSTWDTWNKQERNWIPGNYQGYLEQAHLELHS